MAQGQSRLDEEAKKSAKYLGKNWLPPYSDQSEYRVKSRKLLPDKREQRMLDLSKRYFIMNRRDIIQKIINQLRARNYIEIGVKKGKIFLEIRARKKIAVDPQFEIGTKRKIKSWSKNFSNIFNEYYEMTSDRFFEMHSNRLTKLKGLNVAFIDGLHTYKQSLKDVQNCLNF